MTAPRARACEIEIVERCRPEDLDSGDPIVPNEVRINGTPVLVSGDRPIIVHEMSIPGTDVVQVTLTLFARSVRIAEEPNPTQT